MIYVHFKGRAHYFFKIESAVSAAAHLYSFVKLFFDFFASYLVTFPTLWLILTPLEPSPVHLTGKVTDFSVDYHGMYNPPVTGSQPVTNAQPGTNTQTVVTYGYYDDDPYDLDPFDDDFFDPYDFYDYDYDDMYDFD